MGHQHPKARVLMESPKSSAMEGSLVIKKGKKKERKRKGLWDKFHSSHDLERSITKELPEVVCTVTKKLKGTWSPP